jgi:hypothetical protein
MKTFKHFIAERQTNMQTLYIHRPLKNAEEFCNHFKNHGMETIHPDDIHVTQCYSKTPLDWNRIKPLEDDLKVTEGEREMAAFGKEGKAIVLKFTSPELIARHNELMAHGASHDFDKYESHCTITYNGLNGNRKIEEITPFQGTLFFGAEIHTPVNDSWEPKKT